MHSIRLERRPAFTLNGDFCDTYGVFSAKADFSEKVPRLWQRMHNHFHQTQQSPQLFAVIDVARYGSARLRYWVGAADRVNPDNTLQQLQVPEQLYAVVTHIGALEQLPATITWFITHWLNQSPYEAFEGFDIEEYSEHKNQSRVDYWIPIRPVQIN